MNEDPISGGSGGDDVAKGSGGGVEGIRNLPGNQKHPLLNELVMEVLFKQFNLLNHDDSAKSALARLAELREVCKAWNREIGKTLRKETRINIKRLISSYPEGLGWTATTVEGRNAMKFKYSAPMPQGIGSFENLDVTIKTCEDFSTTSVIQWFQLMGSSVKSLHLTCTLSCFHEHRFIEKVLKEWCPNLVSFTLRGVECYESLIHTSYFDEATLDNQCISLKEFILFCDQMHWHRRRKSCGMKINQLEGRKGAPSQTIEDGHRQTQKAMQLFNFVDDLVNYLDQAGNEVGGGGQIQEDEMWKGDYLLRKLVRRPVGLTSLNGLEPRIFGSHVAGFFQENFKCALGSDGGVLGQLMKMSRVKRLVIIEPGVGQERLFNRLIAMFFYWPNYWRVSLESFEFVGNCPIISTHGIIGSIPKNIFSRLEFPLKKIKFVDLMLKDGLIVEPTSLHRILKSYAESLEELEIKLKTDAGNAWIFPRLRKLKLLLVECEGYRVVMVTILDVLEKLPSLERCELKLGLDRQRGLSLFFGDGQDNVVGGMACENFGSHPLKELKVLDECVDGRGIERVVACFPELKKVELSIVRECGESFQTFWKRMKELPLEKVKVSFLARLGGKENGLWEKAIRDNVGEFKDLEWLELVHEAGQPFAFTSGFSKEFAKVEKLRFMKLTNFKTTSNGGSAENDAQVIKKNIARVVVAVVEPVSEVDEEQIRRDGASSSKPKKSLASRKAAVVEPVSEVDDEQPRIVRKTTSSSLENRTIATAPEKSQEQQQVANRTIDLDDFRVNKRKTPAQSHANLDAKVMRMQQDYEDTNALSQTANTSKKSYNQGTMMTSTPYPHKTAKEPCLEMSPDTPDNDTRPPHLIPTQKVKTLIRPPVRDQADVIRHWAQRNSSVRSTQVQSDTEVRKLPSPQVNTSSPQIGGNSELQLAQRPSAASKSPNNKQAQKNKRTSEPDAQSYTGGSDHGSDRPEPFSRTDSEREIVRAKTRSRSPAKSSQQSVGSTTSTKSSKEQVSA